MQYLIHIFCVATRKYHILQICVIIEHIEQPFCFIRNFNIFHFKEKFSFHRKGTIETTTQELALKSKQRPPFSSTTMVFRYEIIP